MSQAGEIITFQIGNYANFVGAHLFNLQDPIINPDQEAAFCSRVLWREGQNAQRQRVVTPRVLMFDLKSNWTNKFIQQSDGLPNPNTIVGGGGSSALNTLDKIEKGISWDGKVQRVVLPGDSSDSEDSDPAMSSSVDKRTKSGKTKNKVKLGQHEYANWGDFTKWRLHSTDKVAFRIPNFMYNAESDELASYGQGLDVYRKLEEGIIDGIRMYAEDCDYLEGFHMLVDEYDGFTGIAGGILEHIGDEYDKKACLGLGLNRPLPETPDKSLAVGMKEYKIRISNTVQLWSAFNRYSRVFSSFGVCEDIFSLNPVSKKIPGVIQDCSIPSISSAILAATLDSLSTPYRKHIPSFPLHELTSLLNAFGHKMTAIASALPFPVNQRTLFEALNKDGFSSLTSLTPNVNLKLEESLGNLFVMRGFGQDHVMSPLECREYKHANINTVTACLELFCQESYSKSVNVIKDIPTPFKVAQPFPNVYDSSYLDLHSRERRYNVTQGDSWLLPCLTSAHNSPAVGGMLERITAITGGGVGGSMMKMKMFYEPSSETCNSATIEFEDYVESVNDLCSLRDTYSKE